MPAGRISHLSTAGSPLANHHRADSWSPGLSIARLNAVAEDGPFLVCDLDVIGRRYEELTDLLPGLNVFFAMKSNSAGPILRTVRALGGSFEIASAAEMRMAEAAGAAPADLLYSNPVKPPAHIAETAAAGVYRFAFDSEAELRKLAAHAPGASVYARIRVDDHASLFPLSKKFGASAQAAGDLLLLAPELGLVPYGVTFHVGSQCTNPMAWEGAVEQCGVILRRLLRAGIRLEMLNIGGGLPARYTTPVPAMSLIASVIGEALGRLPYRPPLLAAEPGRYLVAESGVLGASVIGVDQRDDERWVYLDVGGYNGMMEAVQTGGRWHFPLLTSRSDHFLAPSVPTTVTGPSCDSSDTLFYDAPLPSTLEVGDRVYIGTTGAYTSSYASSFNGFPPPRLLYVNDRAAASPRPAPRLSRLGEPVAVAV
ncbi:MAG TPA: type III PLP-dependent enzyme [Acidimicrobiia bacterium]|nr:type III PLP-dependent enzyme [Acidimicrobiia bacterium]